jgi:hypothetical protein
MNSESSKTISTCVIWAAVACILTFSGLYHMNIQGGFLAFTILVGVPAILGAAAAVATAAIWRSPRTGNRATPAASYEGSPPTPLHEREAFRGKSGPE